MVKGPEAFRTISEAADEVGVPQHVLRFWETKFSFIRPMKRAGGRRFYRPADLHVLRGIRRLLHDEGYTIRGVQRLYKEEGAARLTGQGPKGEAPVAEAPAPPAGPNGAGAAGPSPKPAEAEAPARAASAPAGPDLARLRQTLVELEAAKARLDRALGED